MRALFNTSLVNVAGKLRTEKRWSAVQVPAGIKQVITLSDSSRIFLNPFHVNRILSNLIVQIQKTKQTKGSIISLHRCGLQHLFRRLYTEHFIFYNQMLPAVMKSAVQSTSTIIFIPSSFDFIRVHNYFKQNAGASFTVLSEYEKTSLCLLRGSH